MNKSDVDVFEKLSGQLISVYEEISLLSKKNPNDAVNKFKLRFLNKLLDDSNKFLTDEYKPYEEFNIFDEDDMPQNSDVVFILSQYLQCFEKFRADQVILEYGTWYWNVKGDDNDDIDENGMMKIATIKPKRLKD
jgi:hypothetical protein